jgi:hypothetical protein
VAQGSSLMALSVRLLTSVSVEHRDRFAALAAARGVSASHLLARLVHRAVAELLSEPPGIALSGRVGSAPATKYTVRLWGAEAARLERRAKLREAAPSGYVAHVLRAHLRAEPPMPYAEFETLKRVVNELAGIRSALNELITKPPAGALIEQGLRENIFKLLPALKGIRTQVQDTLVANSKSWAAPDA